MPAYTDTPTHRFPLRAIHVALFFLCVFPAVSVLSGAEAARKTFDIPAGAAFETLKLFNAQSGRQLLYSAEAVEGVRTSAAKGQLTPLEALHRMFAGTELKVTEDRKDGGLTVRREKVEEKNGVGVALQTPGGRPTNQGNPDEGITQLNPFAVTADKDVGYQAANTLAGSRLNTPLKDTPASISVLTKEFLKDLGATNLTEAIEYGNNTQFERDDAGAFGDAPSGAESVCRAISLRGTELDLVARGSL